MIPAQLRSRNPSWPSSRFLTLVNGGGIVLVIQNQEYMYSSVEVGYLGRHTYGSVPWRDELVLSEKSQRLMQHWREIDYAKG